MGTLRRTVFHYLEVEEGDRGAQRALNLGLAALILANVAAVILETVAELRQAWGPAFAAFERVSVAIFSVEYVLRVWSCVENPRFGPGWRGRLRFALSPLALVDLAAIAPGFVPGTLLDLRFARLVRLLRLLRAFKLGRYSTSLQLFGRVLRGRRAELGVTSLVGGVLLVCAACAIYLAEHEAQPQVFSSVPASLWWGVMTLTTVGYGDVYPVTPVGRMVAGLIAVMGIGLFALPTGILASGFAEELQKQRQGPAAPTCPHCGGRLEE